jgi:LPS export ABC transporter protein LptC
MSSMRAFILPVFFLLLLAGCGINFNSDKSAKKVEKVIKNQMDDESSLKYKQEVQSFKLEGFSKTGENKWSVQGQFANIVDPDVVLKSVYGTSTSKDNQVTLTADRGIYNKNTRSADLKGHVVAVMSDGGKAFMDEAVWNATNEEITTPSQVRIEHSGVVLVGVGGLVKPQKEWARVDKNIRMVDTKDRVITCDGPLEVDYKNKQAVFNNNVVIIDPEQGKMSSDKVIAYFDTEKKQISRVEWIGNVKAVY